MLTVSSTFLSPPKIIDPFCLAREDCKTGGLSARISFSMTVSGSLAYILAIQSDTGPPTLTRDELFEEAVTPSMPSLVSIMEQTNGTVDASHHGIVVVSEPAVNIQIPISIVSGANYTLLIAARYDTASVPCCFDDGAAAVSLYPINSTSCQLEPDCCSLRRTDILRDLRPELIFGGSFALPMGAMRSWPLDADTQAFEQTFALLSSDSGETGTIVARAGGAQLYTGPGDGRQATALQVTAPRRLPVSLSVVAQQATLYDEPPSAIGIQTAGRSLYLRCDAYTDLSDR